jgi:hypothetical protein
MSISRTREHPYPEQGTRCEGIKEDQWSDHRGSDQIKDARMSQSIHTLQHTLRIFICFLWFLMCKSVTDEMRLIPASTTALSAYRPSIAGTNPCRGGRCMETCRPALPARLTEPNDQWQMHYIVNIQTNNACQAFSLWTHNRCDPCQEAIWAVSGFSKMNKNNTTWWRTGSMQHRRGGWERD